MSLYRRVKREVRNVYYHVAHPSLFDDGKWRDNAEAFRARVGGRRVAVVGNAQSIFSRDDGPEIDACDLVVRLNRGFVRAAGSQGTRTDVLCLSNKVPLRDVRAALGDVTLLYGNRDRWVMTADMWAVRSSIVFYPLASWKRLFRQLGGRRPSTGLIAVDFLANDLEAADVRLFGFDWKASKTFYAPELSLHVHDWEAEKRLVLDWATNGRVVLPAALIPGEAGEMDS